MKIWSQRAFGLGSTCQSQRSLFCESDSLETTWFSTQHEVTTPSVLVLFNEIFGTPFPTRLFVSDSAKGNTTRQEMATLVQKSICNDERSSPRLHVYDSAPMESSIDYIARPRISRPAATVTNGKNIDMAVQH